MRLQRGSCQDPACADVIEGAGILYRPESDGFSEDGGRTLYAEARTSSATTVLLEVAFSGNRATRVRFREIQRSQVVYRGLVVRQNFRRTASGWAFELDTEDARRLGVDGPPPIVVRQGQIVLLGPPDRERAASANGSVEIQGGCGGEIDIDGRPIPPPPIDPVDPVDPPPPVDGTPIIESEGCSGDPVEDPIEDDSGGCSGDDADDPDSDASGCAGEDSSGCSGDDAESDTGCEGDSSGEDGGGGCGGDSADGGGGCGGDDVDAGGCDSCEGSGATAGGLWTARATRGTFRLMWPVGLVAWVNRRMRRKASRRSKENSDSS
ncbi:MAG: hypothetical protein AAFV29_06425 [Myxococcota bacterium]